MICFDEITLHKGHGKFVLVISVPELGLVVDNLEDRSKENLLGVTAVKRGQLAHL